MEFTFKDPEGNIQTRWVEKKDWDFLRNFRHRKECYFWKFGDRVLVLGGGEITEEENKAFNEWYKETYPERCTETNIEENETTI